MRSTPRLFMAALALVSTTAFVHAQDSAAPVPAPLDANGTPLSTLALPAIPFADGRATAAKPALTIDRSALTIEPVVPTEKTVPSPAQKSSVDVSASFEAPAGAASVAIVETATNPAPPNATANTAPVKTVETESPNQTGTRVWILLGLVVVALFSSITRYRRRLPKGYPITPLASLPLNPGPVPVPVPARLD